MEQSKILQYIAYSLLVIVIAWLLYGWALSPRMLNEGMANRKKTTDPRGANVADLEANLVSDSKLLQDMLAVKDNKVAWEDIIIAMEDMSKKEMLAAVYSIADDIKEGKAFSSMSDKVDFINRLSKFSSETLPNCMTYVDAQ